MEDSREDHRRVRAFSTLSRSHSRNALKEKLQNWPSTETVYVRNVMEKVVKTGPTLRARAAKVEVCAPRWSSWDQACTPNQPDPAQTAQAQAHKLTKIRNARIVMERKL